MCQIVLNEVMTLDFYRHLSIARSTRCMVNTNPLTQILSCSEITKHCHLEHATLIVKMWSE